MFVNSDVSYKLIITNYVDLRKTDQCWQNGTCIATVLLWGKVWEATEGTECKMKCSLNELTPEYILSYFVNHEAQEWRSTSRNNEHHTRKKKEYL